MDYSARDLDVLRQRAGGRCAYCRRLLPDPFAVEHVVPRKRGGPTILSNLVAACFSCNLAKADTVSAIDPHTRLVSPIFNPAADAWAQHFHVVAGATVGRSAVGRATAALLFRRTPQSLFADTGWWALAGLRDEGLRAYWAGQHARRLGNRFGDLQSALNRGPDLRHASADDRERSIFLGLLLKTDMQSMRCTEADLRSGIAAFGDLMALAQAPPDVVKVLQLQSSLLGQLAAIEELRGNLEAARKLRSRSLSTDKAVAQVVPPSWHEELRSRQLSVRLDPGAAATTPYTSAELDRATEAAPQQGTMSLPYIASVELSLLRPSLLFDRLLRAVDEVMQACGYGQDFDYARGHVLRRRWWALRAQAGELDEDLLAKDVGSWRTLGFRNEIRELELLLNRVALRRPAIRSAIEVVRQVRMRARGLAAVS